MTSRTRRQLRRVLRAHARRHGVAATLAMLAAAVAPRRRAQSQRVNS